MKSTTIPLGAVRGQVVVLGSANADLVVEIDRRPAGGETLLGSDLRIFPGGKGANQAVAAARAGAVTRFLGCMGSDTNAQFLRQSLVDAAVDVSCVRDSTRPTGTAMILLTPDGENSIVVSPGANHDLDVRTAESFSSAWLEADILVLSLEIPLQTVRHVVDRAAAVGVRVLLNAAPAATLEPETLAACDPLIVNEHEARMILGQANPAAGFEELATGLLSLGTASVVITLGAAGSLIADEEGIDMVPAYRVDAIDTTGAGDAFVGATACELARGSKLREAVRFATAMASLTVTHTGAQSSHVTRSEVDNFVRHI